VGLGPVDPDGDAAQVLCDLLQRHRSLTGSERADELLADWGRTLDRFVLVIPHDYRRVLDAQARMRAAGLSPDEAEMAAFVENARDLARVGGS
jgi:glutamate synthase (NADPH/NADH) large chain